MQKNFVSGRRNQDALRFGPMLLAAYGISVRNSGAIAQLLQPVSGIEFPFVHIIASASVSLNLLYHLTS